MNESEDLDDRWINGTSRSFAKLVKNKDDFTGLVAYSLYRMQKEEWAREKDRTDEEVARYPDYLTPSVVEHLRESADQNIGENLAYLIEIETPSIEESARSEHIEEVAARIKSHIDEKTNLKHTIAANVIAWLVTIGITAIALIGLVIPNLAEIIANEVVETTVQGRQ